MVKIRLTRGGAKKRPFYRIVVADVRSPRDGRFNEIVGTFNPLLPRDSEDRVVLKTERIQNWLPVGAKPTDRGLRWQQHNLAKRHNLIRDDNGFSEAFESYAWRHARITDWAGQFPSPEVAAMAGTSLKIIEDSYYKSNDTIRAAMAGM